MNLEEFEALQRKRHSVVEKVDEFRKRWPNSEVGPAQIVVRDYEMLDHNIAACRELIAQSLRSAPDSQVQEDLLATDAFLQALMDIPELDRDFYGDEWSE